MQRILIHRLSSIRFNPTRLSIFDGRNNCVSRFPILKLILEEMP